MSTLKHLNIAGAYNANSGVWPKNLSSGVMFYYGQRVTKEDFRRYRRDGMEMKLRDSFEAGKQMKELDECKAEIQQLKTALEVSETENEKLKWELANVTKELAKVERELFCGNGK